MMHRIIAVAVAATAVAFALSTGGLGSGKSFASSGNTPPCKKPPELPQDFVSRVDNSYYPLTPGTTYRYKGQSDGEPALDIFSVTHQTKVILGVTTTVVRDRLYVNGKLSEDTKDWFAQDEEGTVWYLGEDTKEIENGQVVSTEGSWEAGVDGAKAGIFMPDEPKVGQVFKQEHAKGVAEDCFEVLDLDASVETPFVSSEHALKTKEFTRLDPGVIDHKWFVRRIGMVRDKGPDDLLELVSVKRD